MKRQRPREIGIQFGFFPTGKLNAITDVKGVRVGHVTLNQGDGRLRPGHGPIRTGVTAILPNDRVFDKKLLAGSFVLNGAGEMSGITQVAEWGLIETPIGLTNTHDVGTVSRGIIKWMSQKYSRIWNNKQVVIPVVGECDDSFLNDAVGGHVKESHVLQALRDATSGKVEEGSVGSGTGMVCCDFKGGIGTSSRVVEIGKVQYTVGILVMSNFGIMEELRIDGYPVGQDFARHYGNYRRRRENYGSIIVVLATDLPLASLQLQRLCKRAALGVGRVGSHAAHGSGEIIVGFSTANSIAPGKRNPLVTLSIIGDEFMGPVYRAAIEATEEAIINSLFMSIPMTGVNGNSVPAIDIEALRHYFERSRDLKLRPSQEY